MVQEFKTFPELLTDDIPYPLSYVVWTDDKRYPATLVMTINVHNNPHQPRLVRIVNRDWEIEDAEEYESMLLKIFFADPDILEDLVLKAVSLNTDQEIYFPLGLR